MLFCTKQARELFKENERLSIENARLSGMVKRIAGLEVMNQQYEKVITDLIEALEKEKERGINRDKTAYINHKVETR